MVNQHCRKLIVGRRLGRARLREGLHIKTHRETDGVVELAALHGRPVEDEPAELEAQEGWKFLKREALLARGGLATCLAMDPFEGLRCCVGLESGLFTE